MIGRVMMGIDELKLTDVEKEMLEHPAIGGVILFTRNYESPPQLTDLVKSIRAKRDPILIATDHEGGRVQRFRDDFSVLSPLGDLGKRYDQDPESALALAHEHAKKMASELKAVDVDFSFTPVLDRDCGVSTVIGDRSFHEDPNTIVSLATEYISEMHKHGMPATGKHFPGHGSVVADSHLSLPVDERSFDDVSKKDLQPFIQLMQTLDAIMPAHILFPEIDNLPVGFSRKWLQEILRKQLKFNGVIFSDCLCMKATEEYGDMIERSRLALDAGCDMVLISNDPKALVKVLDAWKTPKNTKESVRRLLRMRSH